MEGDSPTLQFIGYWAYRIYEHREVITMYIHMFLAAVFPIYIASHASLHRPPSASKKARTDAPSEADDEDSDDEAIVEGLTPFDAILFPILASISLGGLYFLIKWMEDPELLNKILGGYLSLMGVFGVGKLLGNALNVGTTFIFPSVWSARGQIYYVDPLRRQQLTQVSTRTGRASPTMQTRKTEKDSLMQAGPHLKGLSVAKKTTPFPGLLSQLRLSNSQARWLWNVRALFTDHLIFSGYVHGLMTVKAKIRLNDCIGLILGAVAIFSYYSSGKVWWLSNLMGYGFCYGTLQLMSSTTFWTGTLILSGLFIYDIVMVFYTPLMITVATTLDVPIKLIFPGPKRGSMLGLGDIVLPGIMIALALRFDLYLHYLRKQQSVNSIKPGLGEPRRPTISSKATKSYYQDATGRWGERFWTYKAPRSSLPATVKAAIFPKTYFYASVIGYCIGMLVTVIILNIFNHAQPALLYLVPSVLSSLWGTALARGELNLMWNYTEDGSLDDSETGVAAIREKETSDVAKKNERGETKFSGNKSATRKGENAPANDDSSHYIFMFSLSKPRSGPKREKVLDKTF